MIQEEMPYRVRKTHFPVRVFVIILGSLLLVGAFHTQIMVLYETYDNKLNNYLQVAIVIAYWMAVSGLITLYIKRQIKKKLLGTYETNGRVYGKSSQG